MHAVKISLDYILAEYNIAPMGLHGRQIECRSVLKLSHVHVKVMKLCRGHEPVVLHGESVDYDLTPLWDGNN